MAYKAPLANTLISLANKLDESMKEATTKLILALAAQPSGGSSRGATRKAKSALDIMFQLFCYHLQVSPYETDAEKSIKQEFARFQTALNEAWFPEFERQTQALSDSFPTQIGLIKNALNALAPAPPPPPSPPPPPPPKSESAPGTSASAPRSDFVLRSLHRQLTHAEVTKLLKRLEEARTHWCGQPAEGLNELSESREPNEPAVLRQIDPLRALTADINRIGIPNTVDAQFFKASANIAAMSTIQKARREVRASIRMANPDPNLTKDALGRLRNALSIGLRSFAKAHATASIWRFGKQNTHATRPEVSAAFVVFLSGLAVVASNKDWRATYPTQADWFKWASFPTCSGKTEFAQSEAWCNELGEIKNTWAAASEKLQRVTPNGQALIDRMSGTEHLLTVLAIGVLALAPPTTSVNAANQHSLGSWCRNLKVSNRIFQAAQDHKKDKSLRSVVRPPEVKHSVRSELRRLLDAVKAKHETWWDVALSSKWLELPEAIKQGLRCPDGEEYVIEANHRVAFSKNCAGADQLRANWRNRMVERWRVATASANDHKRISSGETFLDNVSNTLQAPPQVFVFKNHRLTENCHVTQLYGAAYGDCFEALVGELSVDQSDAVCFARYLLLTPYREASWTERRWFVELPGGKHFRTHVADLVQNYTTFNAHHTAASH